MVLPEHPATVLAYEQYSDGTHRVTLARYSRKTMVTAPSTPNR